MKRIPFILLAAAQLVLFFVVKDDPFFGDAISSTIRSTQNIYDLHLGSIFYPVEHDPGHPTLYAWLLAASWTLFGKSLWVSHLFSCLWATLLGLMFIKIAKLFLTDRAVISATLLLLVFPTYLSQSAMMLNTVAVMTFFLAACYGLLSRQRGWLLAGSCLMMITHTQSTFLLLALACADLLINYEVYEKKVFSWFRDRWLLYTIPFLLYMGWIWLHMRHTGWAIESPNYTDTDHLKSWKTYAKSLALIVWRLLDFGMAPVYLVLFIGAWKKMLDKTLFRTWITVLLVNAIVMAIFLEHTIGHRYFLPFGMLAIVLAVSYLQQLDTNRRIILFVLLWFSLFAGNYLYYPGKTIGDGTLAYRNYFRLEEQIRKDFSDNIHFFSHAPVANEPALKYLTHEGFSVGRIRSDSLSRYPAVLQSNVCAEFTATQKKELSSWYGKSYESGAVYVNVFLNPRYYQKPENWQLREPSAVEVWTEAVKE